MNPSRGEGRALYPTDRLILMHCEADTNMYAKEGDMKTLSCAVGILAVLFISSMSFADVKVRSATNEFLGYFKSNFYDDGNNNYIEVYNPTLKAIVPIMPEDTVNFSVVNEMILFSQINCFGNLYMRFRIAPYVIYNNGNFYRTTGSIQVIVARSATMNGTCTGVNESIAVNQLEVLPSVPFTHPIQGPLKFENESGVNTVVVPLGN